MLTTAISDKRYSEISNIFYLPISNPATQDGSEVKVV